MLCAKERTKTGMETGSVDGGQQVTVLDSLSRKGLVEEVPFFGKDLQETKESVVQRRSSRGNWEEAVQGAEGKGCLANWRNGRGSRSW